MDPGASARPRQAIPALVRGGKAIAQAMRRLPNTHGLTHTMRTLRVQQAQRHTPHLPPLPPIYGSDLSPSSRLSCSFFHLGRASLVLPPRSLPLPRAAAAAAGDCAVGVLICWQSISRAQSSRWSARAHVDHNSETRIFNFHKASRSCSNMNHASGELSQQQEIEAPALIKRIRKACGTTACCVYVQLNSKAMQLAACARESGVWRREKEQKESMRGRASSSGVDGVAGSNARRKGGTEAENIAHHVFVVAASAGIVGDGVALIAVVLLVVWSWLALLLCVWLGEGVFASAALMSACVCVPSPTRQTFSTPLPCSSTGALPSGLVCTGMYEPCAVRAACAASISFMRTTA